ncbi:MAG: hypothetical protein JWP57_4717, partial [Spirosoma sp.]|nr:hypothetical protein [Spirosoma sp.]
VTLAIRMWGPLIGGLIGSLPWVAGPILLFFILEQGKAFGIQSIPGVLTGILALIIFCYGYAALSRKLFWLPTLLLSYGAYSLTALLLTRLPLSLPARYGLVIGGIVLALRFFPLPGSQSTKARRLPFDIPIRMLVATLFVLLITALATVLGPTWSGVLTPFPILTSVLAIFTHTLQGSDATITILRGIMMGLVGFSTFVFLQAFLLPTFSVGSSFGMAFLVNAVINIVAHRVW